MSLKIQMVVVHSPNHLRLKQHFEQTLKDDFPVDFVRFEDNGAGDGDFGSGSWYHALRVKAETTLEWIRKSEGEILIVADADIQFFKPVRPVIESVFKNPDLDIALQAERERGGYNTGFVGIRCSAKVAEFYQRMVCSNIETGFGDQSWLNDHIQSSGLKHTAFPSSIWAYSYGNPQPGMVLHHANCTTAAGGLEAKLLQMHRIRDQIAGWNCSNPV